MQKIVDCIHNAGAYLANREFLLGMAFAAVVLVVLAALVKLFCLCRRGCNGIRINDNGGDFVIMRSAFLNFLRGTVERLPSLKLKSVNLRHHRGKVVVELVVAAEPGADVVGIHNSLRNDILAEVKSKLGIEQQIEAMNIVFAALPASGDLAEGKADDAPAGAAENWEKRDEIPF